VRSLGGHVGRGVLERPWALPGVFRARPSRARPGLLPLGVTQRLLAVRVVRRFSRADCARRELAANAAGLAWRRRAGRCWLGRRLERQVCRERAV